MVPRVSPLAVREVSPDEAALPSPVAAALKLKDLELIMGVEACDGTGATERESSKLEVFALFGSEVPSSSSIVDRRGRLNLFLALVVPLPAEPSTVTVNLRRGDCVGMHSIWTLAVVTLPLSQSFTEDWVSIV